METNKTQTEQLTQDAVMQSVLKNQVRIGNLVDFDGRIETVYAIRNSGTDFYRGKTKNGVMMQSYVWEAIKPIPLTEEWLLKFGFDKDVDDFYLDINTVLFVSYNDDEFVHLKSNHLETIASIKYVHQLQNLYFALTGSELTVA